MTTVFPRSPALHFESVAQARLELKDYFTATFDRYASLFETLANAQALVVKPIPLRHPLLFYFGHTATFFVNKLLLARLINERINPQFESLFAVGVDEMSWDDLHQHHYAWPSLDEVKVYRAQVRALVIAVIDTAPLQLPIHWSNPWWAIIMGVEHERIHLETSSVLIRQQTLDWVKPHPLWAVAKHTQNAPQNQLLAVPPGEVYLNKTLDNPIYGWDNEYGLHQAQIEGFKAAQYLVSNQEYRPFVESGHYVKAQYWEEEGRAWREYTQAQQPTFWLKKEGEWHLRLMTEEIPMPWDWPVEVNYHEAKAFCNWKSKNTQEQYRLPTEDEWYRLYQVAGLADLTASPAQANIQLDHYASPCPITEFKQGDFYDVVGNVWQWTETPIYPFEGFDVHPIYDDFTTPTFDQRHNLMKGGSWISCGNEALHSARYAFRRHFFQHAGFRYVVAGPVLPPPTSHYETDKLLSEYAEFHYGDSYFNVPNFAQSLAQLAIHHLQALPKHKALDLGCASGRSTFELAQAFDEVIGVDFSARFIGQGVQLVDTGSLHYTLVDEGELVRYYSRRLVDLGLEHTRQKVAFYQGDACNLKPQWTGFDFIFAANLIDRLYDPAKFLTSIHQRLNIGGVLMLSSPYTWLEEHTPRHDWLGGFKKDGESWTTLQALQAILKPHFVLMAEPQDVPFVIRETKRKFQHSLAEVTFWQKIHP